MSSTTNTVDTRKYSPETRAPPESVSAITSSGELQQGQAAAGLTPPKQDEQYQTEPECREEINRFDNFYRGVGPLELRRLPDLLRGKIPG
ncbi:MAG: hypothetical protein WA990_12435 [Rubrobacteraceae bacterium]